jgi:glycosyltransferase involved in cell wall biosynthesis
MGRPRVLRLRVQSRPAFASAVSFERAFAEALAPQVEVVTADAADAIDQVLGPPGRSASDKVSIEALRRCCAGFDFLSPDYRSIHLLSRIARIRNLGNLEVRFLVIAHSPALYGFDLALLSPLLRRGDRIIAPSASAAGVVTALCPDLRDAVVAVPHPVTMTAVPERLSCPDKGQQDDLDGPIVVFMGRVVEGKCLHRTLDAFAMARRDIPDLRMAVAGALHAPGEASPTPYARSLFARSARLGLESRVRFLGEIDMAARARLLRGGAVLVNLSTTLEESFGKSVAEAISLGTPAVVTAWDGLPEVVDGAGACVPVGTTASGLDVDPAAVARAVVALADDGPSPDAVRLRAERFRPERVARTYRTVLESARSECIPGGDEGPAVPGVDAPAVPAGGILSMSAGLPMYTWREAFSLAIEETDQMRGQWGGQGSHWPLTEGGKLRSAIYESLRQPLEAMFRSQEGATPEAVSSPPLSFSKSGSLVDRVAAAIAEPGGPAGAVRAGVELLVSEGRFAEARRGLDHLSGTSDRTAKVDYLRAESLAGEGATRQAADLAIELWNRRPRTALDAPLGSQLARLCLAAGVPEAALPGLRDWTRAFPDDPHSAEVWLGRAHCAAESGARAEASGCLRTAAHLLGADPDVTILAVLLAMDSS